MWQRRREQLPGVGLSVCDHRQQHTLLGWTADRVRSYAQASRRSRTPSSRHRLARTAGGPPRATATTKLAVFSGLGMPRSRLASRWAPPREPWVVEEARDRVREPSASRSCAGSANGRGCLVEARRLASMPAPASAAHAHSRAWSSGIEWDAQRGNLAKALISVLNPRGYECARIAAALATGDVAVDLMFGWRGPSGCIHVRSPVRNVSTSSVDRAVSTVRHNPGRSLKIVPNVT